MFNREAEVGDFDPTWPVFQRSVQEGETYGLGPDISRSGPERGKMYPEWPRVRATRECGHKEKVWK